MGLSLIIYHYTIFSEKVVKKLSFSEDNMLAMW